MPPENGKRTSDKASCFFKASRSATGEGRQRAGADQAATPGIRVGAVSNRCLAWPDHALPKAFIVYVARPRSLWLAVNLY